MTPAETRRSLQDEGSVVIVVAVFIIDRIVDEVAGSRLAIGQSTSMGQSEARSLQSTSLGEERLWNPTTTPPVNWAISGSKSGATLTGTPKQGRFKSG